MPTSDAIAELVDDVDAGASVVRSDPPVRLLAAPGHVLAVFPADTRRVLQAASVLGREFGVGMLAAVTGEPPIALLGHLEPAMARDVVVVGEGYLLRFADALTWEIAYSELSAADRRRLHQQAADALDADAGEASESVEVLAHHLRRAAPLGDARRALAVTLRAARCARRQRCYERAAAQYREALSLLASIPAAPVRRQDLLLELAGCEFRAGAVAAAWRSCLLAVDLGRAAADAATIADAVVVIRGITHDPVCEQIHALCWEALPLVRDDPVREARLLAQLATTANPWGETDLAAGAAVLGAAEATGDVDARFLALQARQRELTNPHHAQERLANAERVSRLGNETGREEFLAARHAWRMDAFWQLGCRIELDAELSASATAVTHLRQPLERWRLTMSRASLAAFEGRFADAERLADEALLIGQRGGYQGADYFHLMFRANHARLTGEGLNEVAAALRRFVDQGPYLARSRLAVHLLARPRGHREADHHAATPQPTKPLRRRARVDPRHPRPPLAPGRQHPLTGGSTYPAQYWHGIAHRRTA